MQFNFLVSKKLKTRVQNLIGGPYLNISPWATKCLKLALCSIMLTCLSSTNTFQMVLLIEDIFHFINKLLFYVISMSYFNLRVLFSFKYLCSNDGIWITKNIAFIFMYGYGRIVLIQH